MSKGTERSGVTLAEGSEKRSRHARVRLRLAFKSSDWSPTVARRPHDEAHDAPPNEDDAISAINVMEVAGPSSGWRLYCAAVSTALAEEAAAASTEAAGGVAVADAEEFERRLGAALDHDVAEWVAELERSESTKADLQPLTIWLDNHARSTAVLLDHLVGALEPTTWRTVVEELGPRPIVDVELFLPGSYLQATTAEPSTDIDLAMYLVAGRAAGHLDELAKAMTPHTAVPTPAIVLQARRNADARSRLLGEFGALTSAQVAELAGSEAKNSSALASRWRREGRLVAVDHHGTLYFPAFQFDPHGRPKPVIAEALEHLEGAEVTAWQQALWFTTANGWLEGRRPVDLLDEQPGAVTAAAREALREPVG
jgi:hypothetical protein